MSRSELLTWLNETFGLNYTKIENCGTGAAFCLIMNSIYNDLPIQKLKLNTTSEYDYRINWKILQASFNKQNITKIIDVDRLIKCRLQDNLDLLQYLHKYWLTNHNNPLATLEASGRLTPTIRRNGTFEPTKRLPSERVSLTERKISSASDKRPPSTDSRRVSSADTSRRTSSADFSRRVSSSSSNRVTSTSGRSSGTRQPVSAASTIPNELLEELNNYKLSSNLFESERNFFYNKLIELETLAQNILDLNEKGKLSDLGEMSVVDLATTVQSILYKTQEGFLLVEDDGF